MYVVLEVVNRGAEAKEIFTELKDAVLYTNIALNTYRQQHSITEYGVDGMWGDATEESRVAWLTTDKYDVDFHIIEI